MQEIKEILIQMRTDLLNGMTKNLKSESEKLPSDIGDDCDTAINERERELNLIMTDREREKINEIDEALEKIENKTYGTCEECSGKIPKARLKVVPFARYCIECKAKLEQEAKIQKLVKSEESTKNFSITSSSEEEY